jgi:flagellum-specific peptidoglycan hydrolase FlgJ
MKINQRTIKLTLIIPLVMAWLPINSSVVKLNYDTFSEERMIRLARQIGIRYVDVMVAQSKIETAHYTSLVFKDNKNLFGMKLARIRETTAIGEQHNHADYVSWQQSVADYKLWQDRVIHKLNTKQKYLAYIDKYYAEDKQYVNLIKRML